MAGQALSLKGCFLARLRTHTSGHELSVEMPDAATASDWLPTFEFGLANDSSCLKRPVGVSGAGVRFSLKLDARQPSSRWQPPALNVVRPTAAFEASELSLSTQSRNRRHSGRVTGLPWNRSFAGSGAEIVDRQEQSFMCVYRRRGQNRS